VNYGEAASAASEKPGTVLGWDASGIVAVPAADGSGPAAGYLLALLEAGKLRARIGWRGPWDQAPHAVAALLGRQIRGKATLDVQPWSAS
jgi:hypothetical protein